MFNHAFDVLDEITSTEDEGKCNSPTVHSSNDNPIKIAKLLVHVELLRYILLWLFQ